VFSYQYFILSFSALDFSLCILGLLHLNPQ
jgi:hypothetical protein